MFNEPTLATRDKAVAHHAANKLALLKRLTGAKGPSGIES